MWIKIKADDYDRLRDLEKVSSNHNSEIDDLYETLRTVREKHQSEIDALNKQIDSRLVNIDSYRAELHRTKSEVLKWKNEAADLRNQLLRHKFGDCDPIVIATGIIEADPPNDNGGKVVTHIKAVREALGGNDLFNLRESKDLVESIYLKMGRDRYGCMVKDPNGSTLGALIRAKLGSRIVASDDGPVYDVRTDED